MLLSASPQTMASRDVTDMAASVRAKVMDIKGNPVTGESVSFSISGIETGTYLQTQIPELDNTSVVTDADGYAVVKFTPGAFTTDKHHANYSQTATGRCDVAATWNSTTCVIPIEWKNYPYLSVETEVAPETVAVNDAINVTIRLKGDGWALQPDPIDVVLVIDRSGSMSGNDISPTRMAAAKSAANDFVDQMDLATRDRVALVSFAYDAALDQELTSDRDLITAAINGLSPNGATNMRKAYYEAIKYLKEHGRDEAVKAVILMGDGDWNFHGTPLAVRRGYADNNRYLTQNSKPDAPLSGYVWSGSSYDFSSEKYEWYHSLPDPKGNANVKRNQGTGKWYDTLNNVWKSDYNPEGWTCDDGQFTNQNMSIYAKSGAVTESVKIFSIGFASTLTVNVERDLSILSEATGGKYVWAGNEDELRQVYTDIAGELKTEAGVNTMMDVVFKNVSVNTETYPGQEVFEYVYVESPPSSTRIYSYNDSATLIDAYARNDTANWTTNQALHFDVGTIRLNQTWETSFRFKVLKPGNINIFGGGSAITFNNGTDVLALPDTFVTAVPELNNTGVDFTELAISNLACANPGQPVTDFLTVTWDLRYTGTESVTEEIFYSNDGRLSWVKFDTRTLDHATFSDSVRSDSARLDVRNLPAGQYVIRVHAFAPDTPDDWAETNDGWQIHEVTRKYIRIQ